MKRGKCCIYLQCLKETFLLHPTFPPYLCFNGRLKVVKIPEPLSVYAGYRIKPLAVWTQKVPPCEISLLASSPLLLLQSRSLYCSHAHAWLYTPLIPTLALTYRLYFLDWLQTCLNAAGFLGDHCLCLTLVTVCTSDPNPFLLVQLLGLTLDLHHILQSEPGPHHWICSAHLCQVWWVCAAVCEGPVLPASLLAQLILSGKNSLPLLLPACVLLCTKHWSGYKATTAYCLDRGQTRTYWI